MNGSAEQRVRLIFPIKLGDNTLEAVVLRPIALSRQDNLPPQSKGRIISWVDLSTLFLVQAANVRRCKTTG